jgi:hypothetical protein
MTESLAVANQNARVSSKLVKQKIYVIAMIFCSLLTEGVKTGDFDDSSTG